MTIPTFLGTTQSNWALPSSAARLFFSLILQALPNSHRSPHTITCCNHGSITYAALQPRVNLSP